jgi:hypothetical protein
MVIAFFLSPSGMRGGDRASAIGGVGGDWGVGEKMRANVARTKRKARTKRHTRPAVGGSSGKLASQALHLCLVSFAHSPQSPATPQAQQRKEPKQKCNS